MYPSRKMLAALLALASVAACTPDTPQTLLSWDVNDSLAQPAPAPAKIAAKPRSVSHQAAAKPRANPPVQVASAPLPAIAPAAPAPASSGSVVFVWPVNGRIISPFGATSGGERNDGINIAAVQGTPIHAAAGGTVSYAGDDLKDYGNLVLIKHADGYVTAYAHADRLIVGKGDAVSKGQVIGYAGHTGDVATPQLHFEIRHGTQPLDPSALLEGRSS
jgi:murein DD-endopeptidase MepM/ murein hydrolase activator NlpD